LSLHLVPWAGIFMKRFFFLSILFHGGALLLLFSWEIPLADRLLPGSILEVSLVEVLEKKLEGAIPAGSRLARILPPKKGEGPGEKGKEEKKEIAPPTPQEKKEEAKAEPAPTPAGEEKRKPEEKTLEEQRDPGAGGEKPPGLEARANPQGSENAEARALPGSSRKHEAGPGRGEPGAAYLALSATESGREGIPPGAGGQGPGGGRGGGGSSRVSSLPKSGEDGDPIIGEIMRRIEAAKRYPRLARKMGIEGRTTVRFRLAPSGEVRSVELLESSGSEVLDRASLETVHRAAPLPFKDGWLRVVIVFKML